VYGYHPLHDAPDLSLRRGPLSRPDTLLQCLLSIAEARTVSVGVYANEPTIFLGLDGKPAGILGDLLSEIAKQEGWQLQPASCQWQECLDLLQSGEIDLLPDVAYDDTRAQTLDFHQEPSLYSWSQIYSKVGKRLDSMLDLDGRRIAVLEGSIQQNYLKALLDSFGLKAQLVSVSSLLQGFELVAAGLADGVVANQRFGDFHAPRFELVATSVMFQPAQLFYATDKGRNAELLSSIDRHLQDAPQTLSTS
jgi:ABC-type amino acid transport substrate-binding protein